MEDRQTNPIPHGPKGRETTRSYAARLIPVNPESHLAAEGPSYTNVHAYYSITVEAYEAAPRPRREL